MGEAKRRQILDPTFGKPQAWGILTTDEDQLTDWHRELGGKLLSAATGLEADPGELFRYGFVERASGDKYDAIFAPFQNGDRFSCRIFLHSDNWQMPQRDIDRIGEQIAREILDQVAVVISVQP